MGPRARSRSAGWSNSTTVSLSVDHSQAAPSITSRLTTRTLSSPIDPMPSSGWTPPACAPPARRGRHPVSGPPRRPPGPRHGRAHHHWVLVPEAQKPLGQAAAGVRAITKRAWRTSVAWHTRVRLLPCAALVPAELGHPPGGEPAPGRARPSGSAQPGVRGRLALPSPPHLHGQKSRVVLHHHLPVRQIQTHFQGAKFRMVWTASTGSARSGSGRLCFRR